MKEEYAHRAQACQSTMAVSRQSTCELFERQAEQAVFLGFVFFFPLKSHFYFKNYVYSSLDIWKIHCQK